MTSPILERSCIGAIVRTASMQYCLIEISEYKKVRHLFNCDDAEKLVMVMAYFPATNIFRRVFFNSTKLILEEQ